MKQTKIEQLDGIVDTLHRVYSSLREREREKERERERERDWVYSPLN